MRRAAARLRVAVGHPDRHALVEAEHVAEVLGEVGEERQLGRAGVAEHRGHAAGAQHLEGGFANRGHGRAEYGYARHGDPARRRRPAAHRALPGRLRRATGARPPGPPRRSRRWRRRPPPTPRSRASRRRSPTRWRAPRRRCGARSSAGVATATRAGRDARGRDAAGALPAAHVPAASRAAGGSATRCSPSSRPPWRGEARDTVARAPGAARDPALGQPRPRIRAAEPEPADRLRAHYAAAQRRFGVGWHVLAAVNFVETGFGRLRNESTAGARGPMQFIPATWRAYGLGGDVHDPRDAILGAANYLHANGAPALLPARALPLQPLVALRRRGPALRAPHPPRPARLLRLLRVAGLRPPRRRRAAHHRPLTRPARVGQGCADARARGGRTRQGGRGRGADAPAATPAPPGRR